jgi:hypothetical protein
MKTGTFRGRVAVAMVLLSFGSGCQLVKKLTGRGDDAGTSRSTGSPILGDAGGASPVIALPNPTVSPLPTQNPVAVPTPDVTVAIPPMPSTDGGGAAPTPPSPTPTPPAIAVVDAGAIPAMDARMRHRFHNFCKEHPGQMHPLTHTLCPI